MRACKRVCVRACVCVWLCVCAFVCVVMCVHKYVVSYWLPESIRLCRHGLIRQGEESEQEDEGRRRTQKWKKGRRENEEDKATS